MRMESVRLDLWLKYACIFKQRSAAVKACDGGHVHVNGQRAKPATPLKVGDRLEITGDHGRILVVLEVVDRNVSKDVARTMYRDETPEKPKADFQMPLQERDRGAGRPTKKERREINKWR